VAHKTPYQDPCMVPQYTCHLSNSERSVVQFIMSSW